MDFPRHSLFSAISRSKVFRRRGRNCSFLSYPLEIAENIHPVITPFTAHKYCLLQKIFTDAQITFFFPLTAKGRQAEFVSKMANFHYSSQVLSFCHSLRYLFSLCVFWNVAISKSLQGLYYLALQLQMFPGLCSDWVTCKLLWGAPAGFGLDMFKVLGIWFWINWNKNDLLSLTHFPKRLVEGKYWKMITIQLYL